MCDQMSKLPFKLAHKSQMNSWYILIWLEVTYKHFIEVSGWKQVRVHNSTGKHHTFFFFPLNTQ